MRAHSDRFQRQPPKVGRSGLGILGLLIYLSCLSASAQTLRWWKGNLHTHTLWSDGDDFPEMIAESYRQRGYHFLALSDHNLLSRGERWMSLKSVADRAKGEPLARGYPTQGRLRCLPAAARPGLGSNPDEPNKRDS